MFLIRVELSENRCGVGLDRKFYVELGGGKVVAEVEVHSCATTSTMSGVVVVVVVVVVNVVVTEKVLS